MIQRIRYISRNKDEQVFKDDSRVNHRHESRSIDYLLCRVSLVVRLPDLRPHPGIALTPGKVLLSNLFLLFPGQLVPPFPNISFTQLVFHQPKAVNNHTYPIHF